MGKEVGVGKDSVNRKCTWNMPRNKLRPGCLPQTSIFLVLPQTLKICLPPQGRTVHWPLHSSLPGISGASACRGDTHTEAPQLWEHLSENPKLGTTGGAWQRAKPGARHF